MERVLNKNFLNCVRMKLFIMHEDKNAARTCLPLPAVPSQMHPEPWGGRFMPAPSRLTKITVKNQNFLLDFWKLHNELGKAKFVSLVSFDLGVEIEFFP